MKQSKTFETMSQNTQSFTRLCFAWIEHCASEEYRHDGRNLASHEVAKEIIALWKGDNRDHDPSAFLPLV